MSLAWSYVKGIFVMVVAFVFGLGGWSFANAQSPATGPINWDHIQVLDLETAARMALASNPSLAVAQARLERARKVVLQARSAYWPSLDLEASAVRVDLSENAYQNQLDSLRLFNPRATLDDPENYFNLDLVARWVVFDGFARKFNLAAAQYGEAVSAAARDEAQRLLLSALSNAFLSAQLAQENMAIAEADVAFNKRLLTEAQLRYKVGAGALSDVLNFQVKANSGLTQQNQSESNFQISLISLAALIGLPQATFGDHIQLAELAEVTEFDLSVPRVSVLLEKAYALRPDLQQSDRSMALAEANVGAAKASNYPSLALSAKLAGERSENAGFERDDFGNTLSLGLSYPIFAGGLYKARQQEARAQLVEAQKTKQNVKLTIASEVRIAMARVFNAQRQLVLQQTNAQLVQKNRDLVEKEYKAGVGSLVRLNEAQRDLIAAQVRLATARVALFSVWSDLYSATGEILDRLRPQ